MSLSSPASERPRHGPVTCHEGAASGPLRVEAGSPWVLLLLVFLAAALPAPRHAAAQGMDCMLCHGQALTKKTADGETVSLKVEKAAFEGSVHGSLPCTACHQDLAGAGMPHKSPTDPVNCGQCHGQVAKVYQHSLHGEALAAGDPTAPTCADCHGRHDILPVDNGASRIAVMNIPALCGDCHREGAPVSRTHDIPQDHILANYSMSIHGEGLLRQGLKVTAVCTSCHTAHNVRSHTDPESSIHADNISATCTQCHSRIEAVHRKVIAGRLWQEEPHRIPACVDCHAPHKIRRVLYPAGAANADCLRCHADPTLAKQRDGKAVSLYVDIEGYNSGVHAHVACARCHTGVDPSHDERACAPIDAAVDCAVCHAEQVGRYEASIHGTLHARGDPDAPACTTCHEKHHTLSARDPQAPTFARNQHDLCGQCHRQGEPAARRAPGEPRDVVRLYVDSIHGKGLVESGLLVAATCADCHGAHDERPAGDPASKVHDANIDHTCGACHDGIEQTLMTSIHWPGNSGAPADAVPTCEDCHASHTITRTDVPGFRTRMMNQCGHCHEKEAKTFFDTFHGKVSLLGAEAVAQCSDCHGAHNLLPPHDPASTLSRDNVVATCGECHPGSHRQFAGYLTHATHHDPEQYPWLFWTFWGMTALLLGTLSIALLHALFWLARLWLDRDQWRAYKQRARDCRDTKMYQRFDRLQRIQHMVLLLSFFALALTGMALKFSYMEWAQGVSHFLGGFEAMGVLHRLGAIALFAIFLFHLWDVHRRKRASGKSWWQLVTGPDSILFNGRDLPELKANLKWFLGLGPQPAYGRFTYWEKFDYFAVFWGVLVIGSTGLVLWFPELFTRVLPGWSINVATIIHSDEALLAVGFIFTIHFFNGHFRPDKFPMDPVIFTGRTSMEELRRERPEEYELLVARGELDGRLRDPCPDGWERAARYFGLTALAVGLIIIVLIVYTMLFGYR